jgi:hypothetical protein
MESCKGWKLSALKPTKHVCSVSADKDGQSGTLQALYSKCNMKKRRILYFDGTLYLCSVFRITVTTNSINR